MMLYKLPLNMPGLYLYVFHDFLWNANEMLDKV